MEYTKTNEFGVSGDYYRVILLDREDSTTLGGTANKVGQFLNDYYSTIKLVDTSDITLQIVNLLSGALSTKANLGPADIGNQSSFALIAQRILGLCFDFRRQIDVSGIAKVAELDGVDDEFFVPTESDLRNIDITINNVQNGVMEFEDCNNVKLPVDYQTLVDELIKFRNVLDDQTTEEQVETISSILDTIYQNPDWNEILPTNFNLELAVNKDILKQIPLAVASAVLSPKVLFPIFILLQVVESEATNNYNQAVTQANPILQSGNTATGDVNNIINNSDDFLRVFKSFNIEVVSKIGAIFLRVLYEELKRDILNLLASVILDVAVRQKLKKYKIILRLVNILLILSQLIDDYRKCKSLVNDILLLLSTIFGKPDGQIPLPLLVLTQFLPGYSPERATINTIELLQSVGIPTGPLPDGSPNLMGIYTLMNQLGADEEETENGKTEGAVITPAGILPVFSKKR
jgi:hypothetical protein